MKQSIREQLQKEMTRKQFLQLMTLAVLSILGVNNVLGLLGKFTKNQPTVAQQAEPHGFGSSKFGV